TRYQLSVEVGSPCPDCDWRGSVAHSGPSPRVALDAAARLCGHILDPSVCKVGNLLPDSIHFSTLSVDQCRLCGKEHRRVEGSQLLHQGDYSPRRRQQDNQHRCQPQAACICYRCGHCDPLLAVRAKYFGSMGHVSPLSLRRVVRNCRPSFWYRPWVLCIPPPLL